MTQISNQEIEKTLRNSECLISSIEVAAAYERLAAQLNLHYAGLNPIVMVVMNGGLIPAGQQYVVLCQRSTEITYCSGSGRRPSDRWDPSVPGAH